VKLGSLQVPCIIFCFATSHFLDNPLLPRKPCCCQQLKAISALWNEIFYDQQNKSIMRIGPIILVEDDLDDQEMMREVFSQLKLPNEIKVFDTAIAAYDYLLTTTDKPFIIFSDVNLPKMTGAQLKKKINENDMLRRRSIPFVFLTTTSSHPAVLEAFDNNAQGFFTKPHDMRSLREMVEMILNYWKLSRHPDPNLI
jgi:CheY-like chemotaxis protein